ncbi:MAG: glycosyltransferase family 1 protein [Planctomycetota bacterium]
MKITLATDAWAPQVNGVVRTWQQVIHASTEMGHAWDVIHPGLFKTFGAPRYPEIKLAIAPGGGTRKRLDDFAPDAIHIATEGPIGRAARKYCLKRNLPFTTSYHTQFPYYLKSYFGVPRKWTYRFIRWFHGKAQTTLVPTKTIGDELNTNGLNNITVWSRGVDTDLFKPYEKTLYADLPRPIFLYAGRVALEKNIEAFIALDLPGSKVIVGDGPVRKSLESKYPGNHWAGYQHGEDLARHYASADVFVFPSRTDTFGVVLLEANACGLPTAAYPVTGPIDVVQNGTTGVLDEDLGKAATACLELNPEDCLDYARSNSWERCAQTVLDSVAPIKRDGSP